LIHQPLGSEVSEPRGYHLFSHSAAMARVAVPGKTNTGNSGATISSHQGGPARARTEYAWTHRTDSRAHRGRDRCAREDQKLLPAVGDQRRFPRSWSSAKRRLGGTLWTATKVAALVQ